MDLNYALAVKVIEAAVRQGIRDFYLCPGARNAPFVFLLNLAKGIHVHTLFDERSAGFFALGRAKATNRPVAILCTSGTAVAELLPSAVEATYAGVPLLFITADRPRSYRGKGAPQSIDQVGIFFKYVETCWDLENLEDDFRISEWTMEMPLQINVCFDEPLTTASVPELDFSYVTEPKLDLNKSFVKGKVKIQNPLIVVSELHEDQGPEVLQFLQKVNAPIYLEAISQLRGHPSLENKLLLKSEKTMVHILRNGLCESVLRIGGVPTCRVWRDLESEFRSIPVYSCSKDEWVGLSRSVRHFKGLKQLLEFDVQTPLWSSDYADNILQIDQNHYGKLVAAIQALPLSELALLQDLANKIPGNSIYLGNSMPIREWDIVYWPQRFVTEESLVRLTANRGANGIDGQISTFLGWSRGESWALIGDLTALYDLNAFWATPRLSRERRRLVIINNQGGQIFNKMFSNSAFLNQHNLNFRPSAEQWGWSYQKWTSIPTNLEFTEQNIIIELKPDPKESEEIWRRSL